MKKIAIIGGTQEVTYRNMASKYGIELLFHNAKVRKNPLKEFKTIVQKADCIIVMLGACQHKSMWAAKKLAKQLGKPVIFQKGRGATGAIEKGKEILFCS